MDSPGSTLSFGGPEVACDYGDAKFVVLPVPYDLTTSYMPGARRGPLAILEASHYLELYDIELKKSPIEEGVFTTSALPVSAAGPEAMIDTVEARIEELLNDGKIPVTLGGEHSITLGIVKALLGKYGDLAVVQFDAHTDMRDSYDGSPFSHACVMHRVAELGVKIVQIGIRSSSEEELTPLREYKVLTFAMHEPFSADIVREKMRPFIKGPVYITFDLDGLDPSILPATGSPEPGGLSWETSLACLRVITENFDVIGFDMVELSPIPGYIAADFLAAKLTYKLIGYIAASPRYKKA